MHQATFTMICTAGPIRGGGSRGELESKWSRASGQSTSGFVGRRGTIADHPQPLADGRAASRAHLEGSEVGRRQYTPRKAAQDAPRDQPCPAERCQSESQGHAGPTTAALVQSSLSLVLPVRGLAAFAGRPLRRAHTLTHSLTRTHTHSHILAHSYPWPFCAPPPPPPPARPAALPSACTSAAGEHASTSTFTTSIGLQHDTDRDPASERVPHTPVIAAAHQSIRTPASQRTAADLEARCPHGHLPAQRR